MRQEIAEAELENENGDEDGTSDEDEEEPDRMKELMTSREKILDEIEYAFPRGRECLTANRTLENLINPRCSP